MRVEIENALQRGIPVIPVLVQGARIPSKDDLPATLRGLIDLNGLAVRNDPDFNGDMHRLQTTLERWVPAHGTTVAAPPTSRRGTAPSMRSPVAPTKAVQAEDRPQRVGHEIGLRSTSSATFTGDLWTRFIAFTSTRLTKPFRFALVLGCVVGALGSIPAVWTLLSALSLQRDSYSTYEAYQAQQNILTIGYLGVLVVVSILTGAATVAATRTFLPSLIAGVFVGVFSGLSFVVPVFIYPYLHGASSSNADLGVFFGIFLIGSLLLATISGLVAKGIIAVALLGSGSQTS